MSQLIKDYFENAQLAQAAYAFLMEGITPENYLVALQEEDNFSLSQATQFASQIKGKSKGTLPFNCGNG